MKDTNPGLLLIETAEGVRFSLPLAGPVSRFLAFAIDMLIIGAAGGAVGKLTQAASIWSADAAAAFTIISYFAIWVGYGIFFEWRWRGQTVGKRALGLRVLDASGLRLQFSQIAIRNLMRLLDALPLFYLVGGACVIVTRRSQRLGDLVANTIVIKQRRISIPDMQQIDRGEKYNSLLEIPRLAARLRQQAPPELVQIAYEALLRRDQLAAKTRLEVFREIADQFRAVVKYPEELTASLTDERYARNAVQAAVTRGTLRNRKQTASSGNQPA